MLTIGVLRTHPRVCVCCGARGQLSALSVLNNADILPSKLSELSALNNADRIYVMHNHKHIISYQGKLYNTYNNIQKYFHYLRTTHISFVYMVGNCVN